MDGLRDMFSMIKDLPRVALAALFASSIIFAGCNTIGQPAAAKAGDTGGLSADRIPLRIGDGLKITLVTPPRSGSPAQPEEYKVTITESGTIAVGYFQNIQAAGKTCKEVEHMIYTNYVPAYYKTLGVTVVSDTRFFYVAGEVLKQDRHEYIGGITVTRAISASQGFTEYANRKKIKLIRANGKIETVNWNVAIEHPEKDPPVYPGDKIEVLRRWF
jgi:protein involved in polysaccharide export with SLBB domain